MEAPGDYLPRAQFKLDVDDAAVRPGFDPHDVAGLAFRLIQCDYLYRAVRVEAVDDEFPRADVREWHATLWVLHFPRPPNCRPLPREFENATLRTARQLGQLVTDLLQALIGRTWPSCHSNSAETPAWDSRVRMADHMICLSLRQGRSWRLLSHMIRCFGLFSVKRGLGGDQAGLTGKGLGGTTRVLLSLPPLRVIPLELNRRWIPLIAPRRVLVVDVKGVDIVAHCCDVHHVLRREAGPHLYRRHVERLTEQDFAPKRTPHLEPH